MQEQPISGWGWATPASTPQCPTVSACPLTASPGPQKRRKNHQRRGRTKEEKGETRAWWPQPHPGPRGGQLGCPGPGASLLTQMSCFSPIGKFEYKSTISGVLYMGVVFLVI